MTLRKVEDVAGMGENRQLLKTCYLKDQTGNCRIILK
jgi:hypothetical protein